MLRLSKLFLYFIVVCGCLMLNSCSERSAEPDDDAQQPQIWNESPVVMFHIRTLGSGREASSGTVREMIKTLRIIMIHQSGNETRIEANRLIDTHMSDDQFSYIFQKRTVAGKKRFYLIANEESVKSVSLTDGSFPAGMQNPDLSTFLNYFQPDMPADDNGGTVPAKNYTAAEFEALLGSLYFEGEPSYAIADGRIFLPYSAYYSGFEVKENDKKVDCTGSPMYLVPAATKFCFKFINERTAEDVAIDYLTIKSVHRSNYLMAKLEEQELTKVIEGEEYYWIDWLRRVAEESQDNIAPDDNVDLNGSYGWIKDFEVPVPGDVGEHAFIPDGPADDPGTPNIKSTSLILPVARESDGRITSTTTVFGPLYLPESRNIVEEEIEEADGSRKTQTLEKYTLKIKMRNAGAAVGSTSLADVKEAETEISNLKSLFRNTSVLITITLREGGVNIYAEPVLWNKKVFFGYVKDEDEIK